MERTLQSVVGRRRGSSNRGRGKNSLISTPSYALHPPPRFRYPRWEFVRQTEYSMTACVRKGKLVLTYQYAIWKRVWTIKTGFTDPSLFMTPAGTHTTEEIGHLDLFWLRYCSCPHEMPPWLDFLRGALNLRISCRRALQASVLTSTPRHSLQRLAALQLCTNACLCWYPLGRINDTTPLWLNFSSGKEPTIQQLSGHP
nr:vif protein [Bovine immunodeficiency virus R29]